MNGRRIFQIITTLEMARLFIERYFHQDNVGAVREPPLQILFQIIQRLAPLVA
jgi:hypothetical protein